MEKTHLDMDLDEWEYLPDHGFLDLNNEDSDKKKIFSGKRGSSSPCTVFNMNYFMCPSPNSQKILEPSSPPPGGGRFSRKIGARQQVVPVPIQLEPRIAKNPDDVDHEMTKEIILTEKINKIGPIEASQDAVSQVFFKKMKENEFVDMKMDSPKSPRNNNNNNNNNMMPQLDAGAAFNSEAMVVESKSMKNPCSPRKIKTDSDHHHANNEKNQVDDDDWDQEINNNNNNNNNNDGGFDLWKWSLTGVGAICSFGVAAATICIIIFGSQQRNKQQQQQSQKLRFQIYADDKSQRIKQVVQHATKMNEAISAVRGVPISRARITFGGYYDSL